MTLGEKITMLRKQKGWSQEELADSMDISRQSVSKWESDASVPDLDKIIKLSVIFSVSTDYLLKDEESIMAMGEENFQMTGVSDENRMKLMSKEEVNTYLNLVKEASGKIAMAVSLCILSPIIMIVLGGMAEYGALSISEDAAGGIGFIIMFLFLIVAVPILIVHGIKLDKYEYLEDTYLSLDNGVKESIRNEREAYMPTFQKSIATGVILVFIGICILVIPEIIFTQEAKVDLYSVYGLGILLVFIACGIWFFVKSGMCWDSYGKLLQDGDYAPEKKEQQRRNKNLVTGFSGAYWCIVTAVFLWMGFRGNQWKDAGLIFPVAAVLFAGIICIINAVSGKKRQS